MSFVEKCDTFDTSKWGWAWGPPKAVNGVWRYEFPPGFDDTIQAVRTDRFVGYGTYKMKIRVSHPRPVTGLRWYGMFLYGASKNELDIPELMGGHPTRQMSISAIKYENGVRKINPNKPDGLYYWYFQSTIDFEDGNFHVWEWSFTPGQIVFKVDGQTQQVIDEDPNDPFFPLIDDLRLCIGGGCNGTQTETWILEVDDIEYITPISPGQRLVEAWNGLSRNKKIIIISSVPASIVAALMVRRRR